MMLIPAIAVVLLALIAWFGAEWEDKWDRKREARKRRSL